MANDPKMDQSVMISFDELDDIGADASEEVEETRAALNQLGINKTTGGNRPVPAARPVHVQQLNINEPKKSNALLYFVLILCAAGLVVGGVILGDFLNPAGSLIQLNGATTISDSATATTSATTPPPSDAVKALLAEDQAKEEAEAKAKADADAKTKAIEDENRAKAEVEAKSKASKRSTKRSQSRSKPKEEPKEEPKAVEPPPPPPPPKKSEAASLLSSLKKGNKESSSTASPTPSTASNLPAKLGRSDILSTVRKNQSGINQCKSKLNAGDSRVRVSIRLKIESDGTVSSVEFLDPAEYKGTPLDECMQSRVKRFKFPAFNGSPMSIKLPFIL